MKAIKSNHVNKSSEAVLLLGYGSPGSIVDIPAYLQNIKNGQAPSQKLIESVSARYQQIGGNSPLLSITTRIAEKLSQKIHQPVYLGMRNWHPYIEDVITQIISDGIQEITVICLSPHYSQLSIGAYKKRLDDTLSGFSSALKINFISQWPDQPDFITGFEVHTRQAISSVPAQLQENIKIIFTAHSLPVSILESGDPYPDQVQQTANLVAERLALTAERWLLAYQSAPGTGTEWIGPHLDQVIEIAAEMGEQNLVICPIGFLVDHLEVLYDLDIEMKDLAESHGIRLERVAMLNDSSFLVNALMDLTNTVQKEDLPDIEITMSEVK